MNEFYEIGIRINPMNYLKKLWSYKRRRNSFLEGGDCMKNNELKMNNIKD